MKYYLNKNQIDYVIYHLGNSLKLDKNLNSYFTFKTKEEKQSNFSNKIIFNLSAEGLNLNTVLWNNDIPILFPLSKTNTFYSIENNNLIFHHDLLKSAFYLLSGYQELSPDYTDEYNRFPYDNSIQKKLGIIKKPIVNYYFEIIENGIKDFCICNSIQYNTSKKETNFKFCLTHDIDLIDTYNINDLIYYLKVLFGISRSKLSYKLRYKKLYEYIYNFLFTKNNPHWDFEFLRTVEKENNLRSTYYFLPKGVKHKDAYYSFNENRLIDLFKNLKQDKCEIGIHGSVNSSTNYDVLKSNIQSLEKYSNQEILGIRQHRLMYNIKITPSIHEGANLLYDTTLGFAEHEGFRNSYCHPFKLYNFKEDRPFKTWEIPLNIMDATLFRYRNLSQDQAMNSIKEIIEEIDKFNGVLTLLWHNGNFDEIIYPGITKFYTELLSLITKKSPLSLLAKEIINSY